MNNNTPPVDFYGAKIETSIHPGGWSWSAQLPPDSSALDSDRKYTDGKLYTTATDAQKAAQAYLTRSAAEWELLRVVGDLYEKSRDQGDGTLHYSEYSALCDSITLSDLG